MSRLQGENARVSGETVLMTWTFAKMVGKKRYDVITVEKKIETKESSLKLRETIPITSALARKKRMTGTRGRRIESGARM